MEAQFISILVRAVRLQLFLHVHRRTYFYKNNVLRSTVRPQLKCVGTRRRTGGEVKGKLANWVGSQYPSHHLGKWCIQHYYRWCAHLGLPVVDWTDAPANLNGLVRFAFLRVCHHISTGLYLIQVTSRSGTQLLRLHSCLQTSFFQAMTNWEESEADEHG